MRAPPIDGLVTRRFVEETNLLAPQRKTCNKQAARRGTEGLLLLLAACCGCLLLLLLDEEEEEGGQRPGHQSSCIVGMSAEQSTPILGISSVSWMRKLLCNENPVWLNAALIRLFVS